MMRLRPNVRYVVTTVLLLGAGVVWITVVDRPPAHRPLRVGSAAAAAPVPRLASPATARQMLVEADALALTAEQRARLASLAEAGDRDMAPLQAALTAATEDFSRFAREAQQAGRTRLDEIRARTEDVQALSVLVRERRMRHADETLSLLTPSQRAAVAGARHTTGGAR